MGVRLHVQRTLAGVAHGVAAAADAADAAACPDPPPTRSPRSQAEASRLIAAYGGLEIEDIRFQSRDEFMAMRTSGELVSRGVAVSKILMCYP